MFARVVPLEPRAARQPQRLSSRDLSPWWTALINISIMMRNVAVSALAAAAAAFLISRGNIFSSVPPARQSRDEFMTASLLATHFLASVFTITISSARLLPQRFVCLNNRRPGILFAVRRVCKDTLVQYILSAVAVAAVGISCDALPPAVDRFKLEYYLEAVIDQYFSVACDAHVYHVLSIETVDGQERSKRRLGSSRELPARRRWLRSFVISLPSLLSLLIAGAYIHVVAQWDIRTGRAVNVFVGFSLVLKLTMQEIAKWYLRKRSITSLQHMCIVVSVPTVLIDTQARVVILGLQDSQSTFVNSGIMAAVEVVVRMSKVAWLRLTVHKKLREAEWKAVAVAVALEQIAVPPALGVIAANSRVGPQDPRMAFLKWRKQAFGLHVAETHADMYAEYIAIVCSAAISLLWTSNPHYSVSSTEATTTAVVETLLIQLGIEVAVDYLASVMEIRSGLDMSHSRGGFGTFLGLLFVMLAVVNINMSAILYVRARATSPQD